MMDQLACLRCTEGHALFLDIRTLEGEQVPLAVEADGLQLLVVDTGVHHAHGDGSYGNRRAACERAAKELGVVALRDLSVEDLGARLPSLDDELARRARHVVTENQRVLATVDALRARDWDRVGELMCASHRSLRDDYEVSAPELDATVDAACEAGALGARMTGGGFGGSAVLLCRSASAPAVTRAVRSSFESHGWQEPSVTTVTPSAGARRDG
jgi:galactokinase